jgi:hypothetical protein
MQTLPYLCRFLRWKSGYAFASFTPEDMAQEASLNNVPCQCLKNFQPFGPDDHPTSLTDCSPTRPCYECSPKLVLPVS